MDIYYIQRLDGQFIVLKAVFINEIGDEETDGRFYKTKNVKFLYPRIEQTNEHCDLNKRFCYENGREIIMKIFNYENDDNPTYERRWVRKIFNKDDTIM